MCGKLMKAVRDDAGNPVLDKDGEPCVEFDWKLFAALCPDNVMLDEILRGNGMSK